MQRWGVTYPQSRGREQPLHNREWATLIVECKNVTLDYSVLYHWSRRLAIWNHTACVAAILCDLCVKSAIVSDTECECRLCGPGFTEPSFCCDITSHLMHEHWHKATTKFRGNSARCKNFVLIHILSEGLQKKKLPTHCATIYSLVFQPLSSSGRSSCWLLCLLANGDLIKQ